MNITKLWNILKHNQIEIIFLLILIKIQIQIKLKTQIKITQIQTISPKYLTHLLTLKILKSKIKIIETKGS